MTPALPPSAQPQVGVKREINSCATLQNSPPASRPADAGGAAGLSDTCLRFQLNLQGTGTLISSPDKRDP